MRPIFTTCFLVLSLARSATAYAQSLDVEPSQPGAVGVPPREEPKPKAAKDASKPATAERTLRLLRGKGLISQAEYDAAVTGLPQEPAATPQPVPVVGKWSPIFYGFIEFDAIGDSTQSFNDLAGNAAIARSGSYQGDHGRLMFGVRNSRIGFKLAAPEYHDFRASGILEMDFLGNQPPNASEAAFFTSPTFRLRHFALKIENPYVDVLIGQSWQLFGWQPYFHPNTVEIQGVPGQIYSRSPQIRLSHVFRTDPVNVELAVAASRPPQRDSVTPDGQAGVRLLVNHRKGLHTGGSTGTAVDALGVGVSGVVRRFALPEFSATPHSDVTATGWGISVDALIPIIPATMEHRANALTLTGSYVRGEGIADLFTGLTGGISFPALPNPGGASPAPTYSRDVDNGLVAFDANDNLHAVGWQSFIVGFQYYLPPSGQVWIAANYSQMSSSNAQQFGTASQVFTRSRWADGNVFWDVMPAVRLGLEYAWFNQTYADGADAQNHRVQLSGFYIF